MAKKNKTRQKLATIPIDAPEERPAEIATILWMLTFLATAFALLVSGIVWWATLGNERFINLHEGLVPVMQFVAVITGTLSLVLTPVVYRLRRTLPPPPVTAAAVFVGLAAWGVILMRIFSGGS